MRKIIMSIMLITTLVMVTEAQTLKTPQPSSTQKVSQDFGIGTIDLTYSRPNVKGRKIFGDLVPYGKMWRTGANTATRIKFSNDVMVAGQPLKAGEYSLFTIPRENEWTIIFNHDSKIKGVFEYKMEDDALTVVVPSDQMVKLPPMKLKKGEVPPRVSVIETFTMQFANVTASTTDLQIMWENTAVRVPIKVEFDADVMKQIDNVMSKDARPYYASALYYLENGKDLNKALEWFNKAAEMNPKAYWVMLNKAKCENKLGKKAEALASVNKSVELAKAADNQDYVKMGEALIAELSK